MVVVVVSYLALFCVGACAGPSPVAKSTPTPPGPVPLPNAAGTPAPASGAGPATQPDPTGPGFFPLGQPTTCSPQSHLALLKDCARLTGRGLGVADSSREAFDGDTCTVWNSGELAPQEVSVDLVDAPGVDAILLYPEMTPSTADTTHMVEISEDGDLYRPLAILTGPMTAGEGYALRLPKRIVTRYLRVRTTASPSWVAWRDIMPLVCARRVGQPAGDGLVSAFEDLGPVGPDACRVASDLLGPDCERVGSRSTAPADSERAVFDGDLCTTWDSGELPPRAVTAALIRPTVSGMILAPASAPEGRRLDVTHVIEVSANGTHYRPVAIVTGLMAAGHIYALRWPEPAAAVFVRVRTTASPSRVAWREIAVFACGSGR